MQIGRVVILGCSLALAVMYAEGLARGQVGAERGQPGGYETVRLTLPRGDADAGRQAFLDLRCAACHQVAGETGFPDPISSNPGPDLGAVAAQPAGLIATSIIAPSHALSVNASGEVTARLEGILSPMGDYSRAMTVRQLLDLIAYLEAGDSRGR